MYRISSNETVSVKNLISLFKIYGIDPVFVDESQGFIEVNLFNDYIAFELGQLGVSFDEIIQDQSGDGQG